MDPRVSVYEQTDIRNFAKTHPMNHYNYIVCDASFISLSEIIDSILSLARDITKIILLYKPQFEVGRENLRHTGVPKDLKIVEQKMKQFEELL
jgi:23S rRNA (cytidine1920-2'-O)/16S rRNA (cytidine1409-2'-O)-methyltransferase